jgi:hypothetical protein
VGEDIYLTFEKDTLGSSVRIGFKGVPSNVRSSLKMRIFYTDGTWDELDGKEIELGGTWSIETEKARNICKINLIYQK